MKVLKNVTSFDVFVTDTGTNIPAGYFYQIDPGNYPIWAASVDVVVEILAGRLVGNDEVRDLPSYLTIMMLRHDTAENLGFNNTTNSFVSTNVQAAIEEIRFTGEKNFSYRRIPTGKTIIIVDEQQMTVYQDFKIDSGGEIKIYGEIVIRP